MIDGLEGCGGFGNSFKEKILGWVIFILFVVSLLICGQLIKDKIDSNKNQNTIVLEKS